MTTRFIGLSLTPELVEEIDRRRGIIPRTRYLEFTLRDFFGLDEYNYP